MPSVSQLRPGSLIVKALVIGPSGSGKTGAICELANAGYNVRCQDFDNGLDIVSNYLTPAGAERFVYETLTDRMIVLPAKAGGHNVTWTGEPKAYSRSVALMQRWQMPARTVRKARLDGTEETIELPAYDLGPVSSWTERDVLLIDSMTMQSSAIMRYNFFLNGNSANEERKLHPFQSDWGEAMNRQEAVLEYLYSDQVKCNVIVTAHIKRQGGGGFQELKDKNGNVTYKEVNTAEGKGFPTALGSALPPKVPRYFNTTLLFDTDKDGVRWIYTQPHDNIDCKNPCPSKLDDKYQVKGGGFVKIFQTIRGDKPLAAAKQ